MAAQTRPALETIVVIDHNPDLLAAGPPRAGRVVVIPNTGARGASGARNTGVAPAGARSSRSSTTTPCATRDWLETAARALRRPGVAGVGGRLDPLWATARPRWFPGEFGWAVGASYAGMPETTAQVRNVWTNNMALRRAAFDAAGGFREDFGKVGAVSRPEDTELCLRVTSGSWLYDAGQRGRPLGPGAARHRSATSSAAASTRAGARPGLAVAERRGQGHVDRALVHDARVLPRRGRPRAAARRLAGDRVRRAAQRGDHRRFRHGRGRLLGFAVGCVSAARPAGRRPPGGPELAVSR